MPEVVNGDSSDIKLSVARLVRKSILNKSRC